MNEKSEKVQQAGKLVDVGPYDHMGDKAREKLLAEEPEVSSCATYPPVHGLVLEHFTHLSTYPNHPFSTSLVTLKCGLRPS